MEKDGRIKSWFWPAGRKGMVVMVVAGLLETCIGGRILAFLPMPWRSHQFVFKGLVTGLAAKGHHVDFYTPVPISDPPPNLNQIAVQDRLQDATELIDDEEFMNASPFRSTQIVYELTKHMFKRMLTQEKVYKDLLNSKTKYDAVISEYLLASEFTSYLAHKFKAPSVVVMGYLDHPWTNEIAGLPDNPSYMISYQGRTTDRMTFFERLYNFYITASMILCCYWETLTSQQAFADTHFTYEGWENRPKVTEMMSDADLILVNSHFSMGYPYPKAPHVKEVGGMHIRPPKPLPKDLKNFMDDAPNGVIYFSLGSVVDANEMLKGGKVETFAKVFKTLKQKVVWKVTPEMSKIESPNIFTQTWLPQQDILAHNNTVLFITHGGLQSMVETMNYGVPVIGMPVFFDQLKDVKLMTSVGMGVQLDYDNISETSVSWSIKEILSKPSYRQAALRRQALFRDRPMSPVDEAVYWIEYVMRNGKVLQPASAKMPLYQVYCLDIFATLMTVILLATCLAKRMLKAIFCPSKSNNKTDEFRNAKKIN